MSALLMCPPTYFGIEYEINPWMSRLRGADPGLATAQWTHLRETLGQQCGIQIETVEPQAGLPDLVFTANAGLVVGRRAILSRFRVPARSGEEPVFRDWFAGHGFEVVELPPDVFFEGEGDALFCGEQLYCGYHFRSEIRSHDLIAEMLGRRILSLQLVDPRFYHLDTCFCPLGPDRAMYFPGAFDEYGRRVLASNIGDLIEVSEHDALRFGCNAVLIHDDIVLPAGCNQLTADLCGRGYRVHPVNLSEYLKSGGAAKCLVLRLDARTTASMQMCDRE
ncbi:MAG: amidinotransferase [Candidatus Eisenbacteria bacterium]|nr:amidinotransferase [Candidatus Eisenbacteria bacterium]